jgi:hypothetical protein
MASSKDPIRFGGDGVNLYGYVLDDPVNAFDPSGLLSLPKPRQPGETFLECLDRSAKEFYGEALALSDTNAPLSIAGLAGAAAEDAVTETTEFAAGEAIKNAAVAEAQASGDFYERAAVGAAAAAKAGRVRRTNPRLEVCFWCIWDHRRCFVRVLRGCEGRVHLEMSVPRVIQDA